MASPSRDHIFPDFLAGTRKIPACAKCNNGFGHTFEAAVSKSIAPVVVMLSFSGYEHSRVITYERAWTDQATGIEYDLNSKHVAWPHKPHIIKTDGKVTKLIARSESEGRKLIATLKTKGLVKDAVAELKSTAGLQPNLGTVTFNIGTDMRRLAIKMCVALVAALLPDVDPLDADVRANLISEQSADSPVQMKYVRESQLDALRPPLGHLIYVAGSRAERSVVGIVHIFGAAFQFFIPMKQAYDGEDFAILGTLDIRDFSESFTSVPRVTFQVPARNATVQQADVFYSTWADAVNKEIVQAFGAAGVTFGMTQHQMLNGVTVNFPLAWVEFEVAVRIGLSLLPDRTNSSDVNLPSDPNQWKFSRNYGATLIPVFAEFARLWNSKEIETTTGVEHLHLPVQNQRDIRLLLEPDFWCPVQSLEITYVARKRAWTTHIELKNIAGELDYTNHTLSAPVKLTQDDLPKVRDPAWAELDEESIAKLDADQVLTVEVWDIDPDSLKFM